MSMNTNEVREYIYKNFTPQDIQKAILYYHERTGADLSISKLEVEKIYAQRQQEGRVLPMPKEWTPTGQKYITGKKLFELGIFFLVISILIMLIITGYGIPSENANMLKMMIIIIPIGIGIPILLVAVVMIIAGKSMMKKNKI